MKNVGPFKKLVLIIVFIAMPIFALANDGGAGPGGGDSISQEFYNIAHNLPDILDAKGPGYFSEVNINDLRRLVDDRTLFRVELNPHLSVNGAPKDAENFPERHLVQVRPDSWMALSRMQDGYYRKLGLVFHEVLGLMHLETNDEYHISQYLFQAQYTSTTDETTPVVKVGEIDSSDYKSDNVIIVLIHQDNMRTFQFCENRHAASTCRMLGARGYSRETIAALKTDLDRKLKHANTWLAISGAGPVAGAGVGAAIGAPIAGVGAFPGAVGGFVVGALLGWGVGGGPLGSHAEHLENYSGALQMSAIDGGRAIWDGDLSKAAVYLQQDLVWMN